MVRACTHVLVCGRARQYIRALMRACVWLLVRVWGDARPHPTPAQALPDLKLDDPAAPAMFAGFVSRAAEDGVLDSDFRP